MSDARYRNMVEETRWPFCWMCGLGFYGGRPQWWHGPFVLERAHIVNKPRVEDRRLVVLLCSLCHQIYDGAVFKQCALEITLANVLWLKAKLDPEYWDREFIAKHSVRRLPRRQRPMPWLAATQVNRFFKQWEAY